ncbi:MAG: T9SS type A sorting domain-containing protein [Bacteroidales bacterium]|nr:T9SS type A sorting domain-containing protein [Bacteroidales bacterium]MDZ4204424.1 T9SS type A sorting domain-containing protein [Bacteroidales bacterium]
MKKNLLLILAIMLPYLSMAQNQRAIVSAELKNISLPMEKAVKGLIDPAAASSPFIKAVNPSVKSASMQYEEADIGTTLYDLQSNTSSPSNRLHLYPDGTMAGVWTRGVTASSFPERGTGYNMYSGTNWGPYPTARIETRRAGWPAYAPLGANGEIVVAHDDILGLIVSKRATKGTGAWTQTILPGPAGFADISWPKMVTSGPGRNHVHIIACTWVPYQGLNLALLYYRSVDGGNTWDIQHSILPGMTAANFSGVSGDTWSFAEPQGDKLAFLISDGNIDMFIMKSDDGGTTWQKILIWDNPFKGLAETPRYYCPDGASHLAFDANGKLHVVFGINASKTSGGSTSWYPFVGGIGYWNTDMEPWSTSDSTTFDPDNLLATGHLIGWEIDMNGDGVWNLAGTATSTVGFYYIGSSSMPQIVIDENNVMFMVYSSVTEGYQIFEQNYRQLFGRISSDGGQTWGQIFHLTEDPIHEYDECVFPSVAAHSNDAFHLIYQADELPGMAVRGTAHAYITNYIYHMRIAKSGLGVGLEEAKPAISITNVSQNYPNPFTGRSAFRIELEESTSLKLRITNLLGQEVSMKDFGMLPAGHHTVHIDLTGSPAGIYYYTIITGSGAITRKLSLQ